MLDDEAIDINEARQRADEAESFDHVMAVDQENGKGGAVNEDADASGAEAVRFIPCIYLAGTSDKLLLHFHANGEDAGEVYNMMKRIQKEFGHNVACMEYPGYGVYQDACTNVSTDIGSQT